MLAISRLLEQGALTPPRAPLARAFSGAWERALGRTVVRRLRWPAGVVGITVGGATLGGSGKTPLAIACAAALASRGARVALVGHAYRASPGRPRAVRPTDLLDEVGDEALLAWIELERLAGPSGRAARVVVAPTRAAAMDFAAGVADVIVVDGVAQTAPAAATLALLAVDAVEPWGRAATVPPWGDLRAPVRALTAAADIIVSVGDEPEGARIDGAVNAPVVAEGARMAGRLLLWDEVRHLRVGLVCALARPERVLRSLSRRGVEPVAVIRGRDHGPVAPPRSVPRGVDLWLATSKCALHASRLELGAPLATLTYDLCLPAPLLAALTAAVSGNTLQTSRNDS